MCSGYCPLWLAIPDSLWLDILDAAGRVVHFVPLVLPQCTDE